MLCELAACGKCDNNAPRNGKARKLYGIEQKGAKDISRTTSLWKDSANLGDEGYAKPYLNIQPIEGVGLITSVNPTGTVI
jgi:hypothetical protein